MCFIEGLTLNLCCMRYFYIEIQKPDLEFLYTLNDSFYFQTGKNKQVIIRQLREENKIPNLFIYGIDENEAHKSLEEIDYFFLKKNQVLVR